MKIQNIKAKHLKADYKTMNKQGKAVRIKLINKMSDEPSLYVITFETGAEVLLAEDETLPISFKPSK